MIKRKLQVFISSTYLDLKEERQAAVEAILGAGHIPAGMELFKAGRIYVNGRITGNNSYTLKAGDGVTVRGFGRFGYKVEQGETRKGKVRIGVEVYR